MRRKLFTAASVGSLLMCIAVVSLWVSQRDWISLGRRELFGRLNVGPDGWIYTQTVPASFPNWYRLRGGFGVAVLKPGTSKQHVLASQLTIKTPHGFVAVGFAILPVTWWIMRRGLGKLLCGLCSSCGYNLTGNTSGVCPECGTPVTGKAGE